MIAAAHRSAMYALADRYFAEQCARLGPIVEARVTQRRVRLARESEGTVRRERNVGLDRFRL